MMAHCIIKAKYSWLHVFNLRTLLSPVQCRIQEHLLHFSQNIIIIIIFTYITYIIYSIYTYICLKCTQFLKINAGNSLSVPSLFNNGIHPCCDTHYLFLRMGSFEFVTHQRWVTFILSKGVEDPYKGRMSRACW